MVQLADKYGKPIAEILEWPYEDLVYRAAFLDLEHEEHE